MAKLRLKVSNDEVTIQEGEDSGVAKLLAGCKGKITINSRHTGKREIKTVKDANGEIINQK